jgi:hypothetical protein
MALLICERTLNTTEATIQKYFRSLNARRYLSRGSFLYTHQNTRIPAPRNKKYLKTFRNFFHIGHRISNLTL